MDHSVQKCTHLGRERNLFGCWTTVEIELALEYGYEIINIFQVVDYSEKSDTLFKKYVDFWLKVKLLNSGWPQWAVNDDLKKSYLLHIKKTEGIDLEFDKVVFNPALRFLAKTLLNTLWGKLSQRSQLSKTEVVTSHQQLCDLMCDKKNVIINAWNVTEECSLVNYQTLDQHIPLMYCENAIIASMVSAYGRIELYKKIALIGAENVLYMDTDSVFLEEFDNEITKKLSIGDSLGELSNELSPLDNWIVTFVGVACKTYAYLTALPDKDGRREFLKNKGFTCNIYSKNEQCNLSNFLSLLQGKKKEILTSNKQFVRNAYTGEIHTKNQVKRVKCDDHKRIIINDKETVPFGYIAAVS
jgi:hypothetical protein